MAGNGATDAVAALQDFDGISYTKGSSVLKQLNARLGDEVFFGGVNDHFAGHRFANATMHDLFGSWERAGAGDLSDVTQGWLRTSGVDRVGFDRESGVLRRTAPDAAPGVVDRRHAFSVAVVGPDGTWRREALQLVGDSVAVVVASEEAVVLDVYETSWLVAELDRDTLTRLPALMSRITDDALRSAVWNNVRSSFETGSAGPADVLAVAVSAIPDETNDEPFSFNARAIDPSKMLLTEWLISKVAPLSADPVAALGALHEVFAGRAHSAEPGSTVQHAAFRAAVESSASPDDLTRWLSGDVPAGVELDLSLRWRLLTRLASPGAVGRPELDEELAADPTAISQVEHARAVASLPSPEAKAWAWDRFLGLRGRLQLRAAGGRSGHVATRAGVPDGGLRRPVLRRPAGHRVPSQRLAAGRRRVLVLPTHLAARQDGGPGRGAGARREARPLLAQAAQDHGRRAAPAHRRALESMSSPARRPGPSVRARVTEHTAAGERTHEDRLATEEPLEIRLASPGAPAERVWVTMRTPGHDFELAAGFAANESLVPPSGIVRVAYCTDADPAPDRGVQRRDDHRGRGHRHRSPACRSVGRLLRVRRVRQGQRRGGAGRAVGAAVARCDPVRRRHPRPARPDARRAGRLRQDGRRARRGPRRRGRAAAGRA
nr:ERAP1-like C-terminal domain-containing protein [Nocardioides sp. B-3]